MKKEYDKEEWIKSLKVGDIVCDCRYQHKKIVSFTVSGSGDKNLDFDDFSCSARHCCEPADHEHWFVYMVKCSDKSIYTGITKNIERRINQHNKGNKGAKYTRSRRPVKLFKAFPLDSKSEALKVEYYIKQLSKTAKLKFKLEDYVQKEI